MANVYALPTGIETTLFTSAGISEAETVYALPTGIETYGGFVLVYSIVAVYALPTGIETISHW